MKGVYSAYKSRMPRRDLDIVSIFVETDVCGLAGTAFSERMKQKNVGEPQGPAPRPAAEAAERGFEREGMEEEAAT